MTSIMGATTTLPSDAILSSNGSSQPTFEQRMEILYEVKVLFFDDLYIFYNIDV